MRLGKLQTSLRLPSPFASRIFILIPAISVSTIALDSSKIHYLCTVETVILSCATMEDKVLKALAAGPKKAGEIAAEAGLAKADVDKAIKKLVAEGKVDSPKRCFYGIKA